MPRSLASSGSAKNVRPVVIMNLNRLEDPRFEYGRKLWTMEGFDFDNRLSGAGEVVVKCCRFAYAEKQFGVSCSAVEASIKDEDIDSPT